MKNPRRPFWVYSSSYYIFAVAVCIATFFLVWGLLQNEEETPWIPAGLFSSVVLIFAVIFREIILRKYMQKSIATQRRLDYNLNKVYKQNRSLPGKSSFSLEKNADFIKQIASKSKAARVLEKAPDAHYEVFELCNDYLRINGTELEKSRIDATKLAVFRSGREKVQSFHKFHLLSWASIESNSLIQEAKNRINFGDKLENAQRALGILDTANQYYPDDRQLIDSIGAVKEFIISVRVSHWIEQAERSAFKENYKRAINHYRDALFFLARENERTPERDWIAEKINTEIEKLRELIKNTEIEEMLPPRAKRNK